MSPELREGQSGDNDQAQNSGSALFLLASVTWVKSLKPLVGQFPLDKAGIIVVSTYTVTGTIKAVKTLSV